VTIGQTSTPTTTCTNGVDRLQPTVISGNSYVVPATVATGTITSWSTEALAGAGQMLALKVYRPIGGATYTVVGHDGPRLLSSGILNTFPASLAVKAGDVLGNSVPAAGGSPGCNFVVPGEGYLSHAGNLDDGQSGDFLPATPDRRQNISAVINPSNTFSFGAVTRNKKKGTATLTVKVPNPGELALSGKGVKTQRAGGGAVVSKVVTAPGTVNLLVKVKGKPKHKLIKTGKAKVKVTVTFTPTGGDPSTQSKKLTLKKRLKKH
jgi:hypothetical protein